MGHGGWESDAEQCYGLSGARCGWDQDAQQDCSVYEARRRRNPYADKIVARVRHDVDRTTMLTEVQHGGTERMGPPCKVGLQHGRGTLKIKPLCEQGVRPAVD